MHLPTLAASLGLAAVLAAPAMAGATVKSDQAAAGLYAASQQVVAMIAHLETDDHDYGGHRVIALEKLRSAAGEIAAAERLARGGDAALPLPAVVPAATDGPGRLSQLSSDQSMREVQTLIGQTVASLRNDPHDYGGHRVAALGFLEKASGELALGLQYRQSHATASSPPLSKPPE